jgi:long-chain fatty acid transport protein
MRWSVTAERTRHPEFLCDFQFGYIICKILKKGGATEFTNWRYLLPISTHFKMEEMMRKTFAVLFIFSLALALCPATYATNGDNLIGVGPISRAMGGAGVAAPQDATSAIFANPAAMCFGPYCPGSSVDFAGTIFVPSVKGKTNFGPGMTGSDDSNLPPSVIPAIAVTSPINEKWRFGAGMYGVSGLGVDYKNTNIPPIYTQLQVLKLAPNIAYLITPNFSLGASFEVVWQSLDLGQGASPGYTVGLQLGALYHLDKFNFGFSFTTPESVNHKNVADFDGNGVFDDLKLEAPWRVQGGISFEPNSQWLFEGYARWLGWSSAEGYEDFNWDDQWVFGLGAQWKPAEKWALRLGYNYGKNPVKVTNGWNPAGTEIVQGTPVNRTQYETLRIVGFPAVVEHHFTAGLGYKLTDSLALNASFMFAPENTIKTTSAFNAITLESKLTEWSTTLGLTWYF